eukprot:1312610-Amphidinium_carterae.1
MCCRNTSVTFSTHWFDSSACYMFEPQLCNARPCKIIQVPPPALLQEADEVLSLRNCSIVGFSMESLLHVSACKTVMIRFTFVQEGRANACYPLTKAVALAEIEDCESDDPMEVHARTIKPSLRVSVRCCSGDSCCRDWAQSTTLDAVYSAVQKKVMKLIQSSPCALKLGLLQHPQPRTQTSVVGVCVSSCEVMALGYPLIDIQSLSKASLLRLRESVTKVRCPIQQGSQPRSRGAIGPLLAQG